MKWMKKTNRMSIKVIFGACVVLLFSFGAGIGYVLCGQLEPAREEKKADTKKDLYVQLELFGDALSIIRSDYVDVVESQKLVYGALKGLLSNLDRYSQFLEPDDFKEIKVETRGEFGGIGIEINIRDGLLTIVRPLKDTPAEKAGVMAGDRIVRIGSETTKGISLNNAVKKLRGKPGTDVDVTIWREKDDKLYSFTITRQIIKIKSVKRAEIIEEKIGYIKLSEFQENTPKDLEKKMEELEQKGMDSLILDLRDNPGGLLNVSVAVAEKFLPGGNLIVSTKSRVKSQNMEFKASHSKPYVGFPLVVMVNRWSASASEIVAGAIQDNKRGPVLGTKTFGKGSVQTVIPLKDGSALRLTTASYFTPSGRSIREQGIMPDVIVEREILKDKPQKPMDIFDRIADRDKDKKTVFLRPQEVKEKRDNQLERAIDLIKGLKASMKAQKSEVSTSKGS